MPIPDADLAYLAERSLAYHISQDSGMTCIMFPQWPLPPGYDRSAADLLIQLSPGYPDVPIDMWWFDPAVRLADGRAVPATEATGYFLGRSWQRWSRHFQPGQWRSGIDGLESFIALIGRELARCAVGSAA